MNRYHINKIIRTFVPVTSETLGAPRQESSMEAFLEKNPSKGDIAIFDDSGSASNIQIPDFFSPKNIIYPQTYFSASLNNARVWGRNGAVIGDGDCFITDVSREFDEGKNVRHSVFYTLRQVKAKKYRGNMAVIGTSGAYVYYHWMLDILPRLGLLSRQIPLNGIDYFITEFTGLSFQVETLEKLEIPVKKVIPSNENWNFHVKADTLYVPSLVGPIGQPTPFQFHYLQNLYADSISRKGAFRKIYISRKITGRRYITNEDELVSFLEKFQFEIIDCETLSVAEQVFLFSEAAVIIGSHGSAFTNLVFCKPGAIVMDIFNTTHTNPCFWIIAQLAGLQYFYFQGKSVPINQNPKSDNTVINIDRFKEFFKKTFVLKEQ